MCQIRQWVLRQLENSHQILDLKVGKIHKANSIDWRK